MKLTYIINEENNINFILKNKLNISNRLYKKIKDDRIYINGKLAKTYSQIKCNDILSVDLDFIEDNDNIVSNKNISLDILYEDEWLIIVNKQAGLPVHPAINYYENSLSNGLKYYYEQNNIHKKIRPINRLDKNTSGIVIFAKSEYIQEQINYQMKNNTFIKEYIAIVEGNLTKSSIIDKPIKRKLPSIMERCISDDGEKAITEYEVLKNYEEYTLIKCRLLTGRTHQIRVHMQSINHPIVGDTLYGNSSNLINRQALHAMRVQFIHPINKKTLEIYSKIPSDILMLINNNNNNIN